VSDISTFTAAAFMQFSIIRMQVDEE